MAKLDTKNTIIAFIVVSCWTLPILVSCNADQPEQTPIPQVSTFHHQLNGTWYDSEEEYRAELRKHADEERARELQSKIQNTPAEDNTQNITVDLSFAEKITITVNGQNYHLCPVTQQ